MACSQTLKNLTYDCQGNAGGVKEIFIMDKALASGSGFPFTINATDLTFSASQVFPSSPTQQVFRLEMPRGAASFGTTAVINRETGANYFDNTLAIALNKLTSDGVKAFLLRALVLGTWVVFARDNNDVVHLIGSDGEGALATDGTTTTGTALTDRNGENVTLTASESYPAPTAEWSAVAAALISGTVITPAQNNAPAQGGEE